MNSAAAASIILFVVVAAALNALAVQVYSARKLAWAWTGERRSRYLYAFLLSMSLALLVGATATLGILVWLRGMQVPKGAQSICSVCAQLMAGVVPLFMFQQRDFVHSLSMCCSLFAPRSLHTLCFLLALTLLADTAWTIAILITASMTLTSIPSYLLMAFLALSLLLSVAYALAPPMHSERHYQLMWIVLALSQAAGIVTVLFAVILADELILRAWLTVAWFVGTIVAVHVYTTLEPPPAPETPTSTGSIALPITPRITVHKERFLSSTFSDAESRVHKPSSPITPTELYMYENDPFASPPASVSIHSHQDSFEDLAFGHDKSPTCTRTRPSRKRSARYLVDPSVPMLETPTPRHRERKAPPVAFLRDPRNMTLDVRLSEVSTLVGSQRG